MSYIYIYIYVLWAELQSNFLTLFGFFQDLSSRRMIGTNRRNRGHYLLHNNASSSSTSRTSFVSSYFTTSEKDCMLWHFRLGHLNFQCIEHLFPHLFSKVDVFTLSCDVHLRAKQHPVFIPSQPYKPTQPFTLIHSDVWGPSKVTISPRKLWFMTFIDDHTRLTGIFLISNKSEVTSIFQDFYHTVEMQFNAKIAILQSEWSWVPKPYP